MTEFTQQILKSFAQDIINEIENLPINGNTLDKEKMGSE